MKSIYKKSWFIIAALVFASIQQLSAQTLKDFFKSPDVPLTYLGIDYTQAKILNELGGNPNDVRDRQFAGMNQVVIQEVKKYDLTKVFDRPNITNDLSFVTAKNAKIDADKIFENSSDEVRFKNTTIESIVKGYDFGSKKGIGFLIVMESMNKTSAQASMYVTFVDMASRKVLYTERMTGKAGGIGFRNYWIKPVFFVFEEIRKSKYDDWKEANAK
ncbi:MAG: hypothetical protein QM802_06175 [Agriterribacter sp.]